MRVIEAVQAITSMHPSASKAFVKYCSLKELSIDDAKFCYDTETMRKDIFRLLDYGADASRICKKVGSTNPHFCTATGSKTRESIEYGKENRIKGRGIIYE